MLPHEYEISASSAMINTLIFMYNLTKIQPVKLRAFVQYSCANVKADGSQNLLQYFR